MKKKLTLILFLVFGFSLLAQDLDSLRRDSLRADAAKRRDSVIDAANLEYSRVENAIRRDSLIQASIRSTRQFRDSIISLFVEKLETISFVSGREWVLEGHGITQIWSDAVQLDGCDTLFRASISRMALDTIHTSFLPSCRPNPDYPGDLISWEAVNLFGDVLCPAPWRVPTADDFCDLNRILFDKIRCHSHAVAPERVTERFVDLFGGVFAGVCTNSGVRTAARMFYHETKAYYWSQTEYDYDYAFYLDIDVHGNIQPRSLANTKAFGYSVRCVR